MTTREKAHKLLDELPESEIEPVLDFIASRNTAEAEEWGDLDTQMDAAMTASLRELDEEERKAGLDNTGPIAKGHLTRRIATLGPEKMDEVCRALARATSC